MTFSGKGTFSEHIANIQALCRNYSGTPNQQGMYDYYLEAVRTTNTILQRLEECCEQLAKEAREWDPVVEDPSQDEPRDQVPMYVDIHAELEKVLQTYHNIPDNQQGMAQHLSKVRSDLQHLQTSVVHMRDSFLELAESWNESM